MRQRLANKVTGDLAGLWLLAAEHLRLGTWDLLRGWTGQSGDRVEPRLAMQLVHEATVCTSGIRAGRTLHDRGGFELVNGLPFVATDEAIHHLLDEIPVARTKRLQTTLGKSRLSSGHFKGKLLALDPHRVPSASQREMRERVPSRQKGKPIKMAQTFWALDADTHQPICFTTGTASRSVADATPELMDLVAEILQPTVSQTLVVADTEHFSGELIADIHRRTGLDLLVPLPHRKSYRREYEAIANECFTRHWAGYATAKDTMTLKYRHPGTYHRFVQRQGERDDDWRFNGFLSTADGDPVEMLAEAYPKRWHVEEFFNANQALGWNRGGTMNLNIRYAQMTMALIAQTAIHQLRQRLGAPYDGWDAAHLAKHLFHGLNADIRIRGRDTIVVKYYNAPEELHAHYIDLPTKLAKENVNPTVPWLYGYKLDFEFK